MLSRSKTIKAAKVVVMYAPEDQRLKNDLMKQLSLLERQGNIQTWDFSQIQAGENPDETILKQVNDADIILCLLSPDFFMLEYYSSPGMQRVWQRKAAKEINIIPVLFRDVSVSGTPFEGLLIIPRNQKSIKYKQYRDKVFKEVIEEIEAVVQHSQRSRNP